MSLTTDVAIVAPLDRPYDRANVGRVADRFPGEGPLGGIISALQFTEKPTAIVVSCDQFRIDTGTLATLVNALGDRPAVCFADEDDRLNPLPLVLRPSVLPVLADMFDQGERQLRAALERIGAASLVMGDYWQLRDADRPGDLAEMTEPG
jgi:molybdopterin-guanine dinucleotide biosynthesis protein A